MRISLASAKAKATLRWYLLMILFGGIAGAGYGAFISGLCLTSAPLGRIEVIA